ncbi:hypothetical protein RvY_02784 [Ramazzottius varieornatus]|uniref:Acyltransferase n=1 Tax=Ramazzottius varieornatus TaxID=947166 RepID=A0A1D1UPC2_RAMVA|nr:hypothetical protein RvY_02784 [Ramazzottius varieornatus]
MPPLKITSNAIEKACAVTALVLYVVTAHDLSSWLNYDQLTHQYSAFSLVGVRNVPANGIVQAGNFSSQAIPWLDGDLQSNEGHLGWGCWMVLAYALWYLYDRDACKHGGRPIQAIRRSDKLSRTAATFPITLEKTHELDPERKYIIGYHPHGVSGGGAFFNFATEATGLSKVFPGIDFHLLTHSSLHHFPIFRDLVALFGMADVSRQSISYCLKGKGKAVVIIVGGAKEALMSLPDKTYIVLKNRKGFVRVALQNGADLVPSFSFGENQLWKLRSHVFPWTKLNLYQKVYNWVYAYPPVLLLGQGMFNTPFRLPVHTIVGKPINVEKDSSPSEEKVDEIHRRYMEALIDLYETSKSRFNIAPENKLIFVD